MKREPAATVDEFAAAELQRQQQQQQQQQQQRSFNGDVTSSYGRQQVTTSGDRHSDTATVCSSHAASALPSSRVPLTTFSHSGCPQRHWRLQITHRSNRVRVMANLYSAQS